jgi:hypothetical protein
MMIGVRERIAGGHHSPAPCTRPTRTSGRARAFVAPLGAAIALALAVPTATAQSWQGVVVQRGASTFYIQDGTKRPIEPPATPACLGDALTAVDSSLVDSLPLGPPKTDCEAAQHAVTVFDYTFDMPGQPALQHIRASIRMDETGRLGGSIDYENRDNLSPFCGGIVAGVYGSDGTLLQLFTSPIRCTPAMGANGENAGEPWRRHFTWTGQLREEYVPRAAILDVRAVATGDVKVITAEQAREALQRRTGEVSRF